MKVSRSAKAPEPGALMLSFEKTFPPIRGSLRR
jgi:hypothetical protein